MFALELQTSKNEGGILVERKIGISLNRLGTRNYLASFDDQFSMSKDFVCIVINEFCVVVLKIFDHW